MATPLKLFLTHIRCLEETDEVGADEPYVLVTAVNLKPMVPQVETIKYGPWSDVDKGELKRTAPIPPGTPQGVIDAAPFVWRFNCWGVDGKPAPIARPEDVAIMVSVMEHDDGSPSALRGVVKAAAVASLAGSMGMSRGTRVEKLADDINSALKIPTGAPNFDDRVGGTKELALSGSALSRAAEGGVWVKKMLFTGDGGQYRLRFELRKG